jgi:resolvase-like protein
VRDDDLRLRPGEHRWQTLDAQLGALKAARAEKVFAENISGAKTDRVALAKALAALSAGDVLVVTRLDRLARSTRDLLNMLATVAERGTGSGRSVIRRPIRLPPAWEADTDDPGWVGGV